MIAAIAKLIFLSDSRDKMETKLYGQFTRYECCMRLFHSDGSDLLTVIFRTYCCISKRIKSRNRAFEKTLHTPGRRIAYDNRVI